MKKNTRSLGCGLLSAAYQNGHQYYDVGPLCTIGMVDDNEKGLSNARLVLSTSINKVFLPIVGCMVERCSSAVERWTLNRGSLDSKHVHFRFLHDAPVHSPINSGGNMWSSHSNCSMAEDFPEKSNWHRNEVYSAVSSLTDWIYIRTHHLYVEGL